MTTRIAETFSCTLAFSASYFLNTRLKSPMVLLIKRAITMVKNTSATQKICESLGLMRTAINMATISETGARKHMRRIII